MQLDSLRMLYAHELNDLHDAETQLIQALPKMAEAASSEDLRRLFQRHLEHTLEQVRRLEGAFSMLKEKPVKSACKAMKGILEEAKEMIKAEGDPAVKDAGLVSAAQRIEHYKMAGYGCARTYAKVLDQDDAADLLQKTLDEQREVDEKLTKLAKKFIHREPAHV
jgi:ferritin-like metal-binding protein YciE